MTLPMGDAGALRDVVRDALAVEIPRKVTLLRAARGWSDVEMPHAQRIVSGEVPDDTLTSDGDTWVIVINPRLLSSTQVDLDERGLPVYMSRYACRVQVWAKAADQVSVLRARDRLTLAVKLSLLEWLNLKPGFHGDTGYRLHRDTYTERFLEPKRIQLKSGGRSWAPALVSIDVDVEEALNPTTRPPLGTAQTITQDAYAVGPQAPLIEETP